MKKIVLLMSVLTMSAFAQTANTTNQPQGPKGDRPPISAEMKAAFDVKEITNIAKSIGWSRCFTTYIGMIILVSVIICVVVSIVLAVLMILGVLLMVACGSGSKDSGAENQKKDAANR